MRRPSLEGADIFRAAGSGYRRDHAGTLTPSQRRVMSAIERCRTAAVGGHVEHCAACGHQRQADNSCRNRHCPKCQSLAKAQWLDDRRAELLPVAYFPGVFTLPEASAALASQNQPVLSARLFRAAAETWRTLAAAPKQLGAELGFIAGLPTWGQTLLSPPHLPCVVPGGGLAPDGQRWVACRPGFCLPVRVLSRLFRRRFLEYRQAAFAHHQLQFFAALAALTDPQAVADYGAPVRRVDWVVYAQPPFGGSQQGLDYLGRSTHRVAIANQRLVQMTDDTVTCPWRDYRHHHQRKQMTLTSEEFMRRFLLHVLPAGFQRIRHYGFLSHRHRQEKLSRCRRLLGVLALSLLPRVAPPGYRARSEQLTGRSLAQCPACGQGRLGTVAT